MSDDITKFDGEQADVFWDRRLCIHIGECGRAEGDLFVGGRKPWCKPDLVQLGAVHDVVERCPTGAITYQDKSDDRKEEAAAENTVLVANNGPLYLRGDLTIDGAADDMPGVRFRAALCRCGKSKNKPFCDNSHETAEFIDRGAIGDTGEPLEETGGNLAVKRAKNGPLLLSGNLTIVSGSGRRAWTGKKCALCRCGESKNKPFCDGTHSKTGFEAD